MNIASPENISKLEKNNQKKLFLSIASVMQAIAVSKSEIDTGKAGKYKAFTMDNVLEETKRLLPQNNIITFVKNELYETQYITKTTQYGDKITHNVIIKTTVTFIHTESLEEYSAIAYGEASDAGDKALSKAQTDGFKKALCQTLHLFDDDGDKDNKVNDDKDKVKNIVINTKKDAKQCIEGIDFEKNKENLMQTKNIEELKKVFTSIYNKKSSFTPEEYNELEAIKNNKKEHFEN